MRLTRRFSRVTLAAVFFAGIATGCNGGKIGGGKAATAAAIVTTAGTTTGATTTAAVTSPSVVTLQSIAFVDADKNGVASKGDQLVVTFSDEVTLTGTDPLKELVLPVTGDSFGTGATVAAGAKPIEVVVTLGDKPALRVSGKFDPAAPGATGEPSGLDLSPGTTIRTLKGTKPTSLPMDVDGTVTAALAAAGTLQVARGGHTATLLDDGRILVVGGFTTTANGVSFAIEAEVFDPLTNTFTKTTDPTLGGAAGYMVVAGAAQAIPVARVFHTATKLANGQVLIAGGFGVERLDATGQAVQEDLRSAHLFDPKTNKFSTVQASLALPRSSHFAALLSTGKVLIAGGFNGTLNANQGATLPAAEVFDPAAGTFTPLSTTGQDMVVPRQDGVCLALPGVKQVLLVGGVAIAQPTGAPKPQLFLSGAAEAFDEGTTKFAATKGKPANDLRLQASALLSSGPLILGGDGAKGPSGAVEAYDAAAGTFSTVGALTIARAHAAADAASGREAVVAGGTNLSGKAGHELKSVEVFDRSTGKTTQQLDMKRARNGCTVTRVKGGLVIIGGFDGDAGTSLFSLGGQPVAEAEKLVLP